MAAQSDAWNIRLLSGRHLSDQDTTTSEPVAVVNETLARRFALTRIPSGVVSRWGGAPAPRTVDADVVGVVADVKRAGLTSPTEAQTWTPWGQLPDGALGDAVIGALRSLKLMVRRRSRRRRWSRRFESEVRAIDRLFQVTNVRTLDEVA